MLVFPLPVPVPVAQSDTLRAAEKEEIPTEEELERFVQEVDGIAKRQV